MNEFEQYRRLLFSVAYRMTGSMMDAEDIVQDTFLRYQKVDSKSIENPKAYLTSITTRLAINHLSSAKVQREKYLGPWLPEPVSGADQRLFGGPAENISSLETISMAVMVLLEKLTPAERAVFLLREVFDYSYAEIAEMLDKSEAACRKLFSRAKGYLTANRPRYEARPSEHRRLLEQFAAASENGDMDGLTHLLTKEATLSIDGGGKVRGAATRPLSGRDAVVPFLMSGLERFTPAGSSYRISEVNGLPALLVWDPRGALIFVATIDVKGAKIDRIWVTVNPEKMAALQSEQPKNV